MTDVPVLIVAFNRPDRLGALLELLRTSKPSTLYVAVDGPRSGRDGEKELVLATRDQLASVDWECRIETLFRDENLGCGRGVSGAVSWLFEREERGIILEDDIRPLPSFFPFCEELLDRYEHDGRVWAVSGCNFVPAAEQGSAQSSYRFSAIPHIWGWATWRRSWSDYRLEARGWHRRLSPARLWRVSGRSPWAALYWGGMFELVARRAIDTWDLQAVLTAFADGGLTATSNVNLVKNVGFGADSTHTAERPTYLLETEPVDFPLRHPESVIADRASDDWTRRHVLGATPTGLLRQGRRFVSSAMARS